MKVVKNKKAKSIIYYLSMLSTAFTLVGCTPSTTVLNNLNANTISNSINIEDYMTEYDTPQDSEYVLVETVYKDGKFIVDVNGLSLKSSIYVSSNPSMYGYQPVDLDILNNYSIYYINPNNGWIESYLNDKQYTCKNISIEQYVDENNQEYLLYKCDVYVVTDFELGKTVELSGKVWPIQDIATIVPIAPIDSFYVTYTALYSVDEYGYIRLISDKQDGYDKTCLDGKLDSYLKNRNEIKDKIKVRVNN